MITTHSTSPAETLNDLLTSAYDAEQGYTVASEHSENQTLKDWLLENAQERKDFGHRIKSHLAELGAEPERGASLSGKIHQAFIKLRAAVNKENDLAIVAECIRGENQALKDYQNALTGPELPSNILQTIEEQAAKTAQRVAGLEVIQTALKV